MTAMTVAGQPGVGRIAVSGLRVRFDVPDAVILAVNGVDLDFHAGESVALVGESGSGKTVLGRALLGLHDRAHATVEGSVTVDGTEIVDAPDRVLQGLRGRAVGLVPQDPRASLNPVLPIGRQITEVLRRVVGMGRSRSRARAVELLHEVGMSDPRLRTRQYPHQLSGGQLQRVCIATALAAEPRYLVADEPTTALDVTVQRHVLDLLQRMQRTHDFGLLLISHDLELVREYAARTYVMYAGTIVEEGTTDEILNRPRHPYTAGLVDSSPRLFGEVTERAFRGIPGVQTQLAEPPTGCPFAPRCERVVDTCMQAVPSLIPEPAPTAAGRRVACIRPVPLDVDRKVRE